MSKPAIISDTAKSAKNLAQQIARQMAQEPLEVLKDIREQTVGTEPSAGGEEGRYQKEDEQKRLANQKQELNDSMKSSRLYEALQRELDDIGKHDLFKDLQRRISEGEEIPLEDYHELSIEQKQVLKAQMEAVKNQQEMQRAQSGNVLQQPSSKRSRRFGAGQKQEAEKQQTRVEKPVPPSG